MRSRRNNSRLGDRFAANRVGFAAKTCFSGQVPANRDSRIAANDILARVIRENRKGNLILHRKHPVTEARTLGASRTNGNPIDYGEDNQEHPTRTERGRLNIPLEAPNGKGPPETPRSQESCMCGSQELQVYCRGRKGMCVCRVDRRSYESVLHRSCRNRMCRLQKSQGSQEYVYRAGVSQESQKAQVGRRLGRWFFIRRKLIS